MKKVKRYIQKEQRNREETNKRERKKVKVLKE